MSIYISKYTYFAVLSYKFSLIQDFFLKTTQSFKKAPDNLLIHVTVPFKYRDESPLWFVIYSFYETVQYKQYVYVQYYS